MAGPVSYPVRVSAEARRLVRSIERRIEILDLDLSGLQVATEAATGPYAATAVIAAMAGGIVHACARDTRKHGTAAEAIGKTEELARLVGVSSRISFSQGVPEDALRACDILTNSGRIRPIDRGMIDLLPAEAVIALMFEAWEFRETDIDRAACDARGIRIAAVNERHADVAVFPFLGQLCVRQLRDAGMTVRGQRVAVICDNPFAAFLLQGLADAGAEAAHFEGVSELTEHPWDAVVIALLPRTHFLDRSQLEMISARAAGAIVAQFWGDIDRAAALRLGIAVHPQEEPDRGHMGILLNRLGHEPIVRLQAGSLKAAELVRRNRPLLPDGIASLL